MKLLTTAIQESLVAIICFDLEGAKQARALVRPTSYDPYFRHLVEAADEYFDKYHRVPGDHTSDLIDALKEKEPDNAEIYDRIYASLLQTKEGVNRDYILANAKIFARKQNCKATASKVIKLLQRDDNASIDEAEAIMAGIASKMGSQGSPGTLMNDPNQALRFLNRDEEDYFPLGIPHLDKFKLGPTRKKYLLIVGATNTGKSWAGIQIGKMGLIHGAKVCHITLEMSEDEVAQRYVQSFCSVGKREAKTLVPFLKKDEDGKLAYSRKEIKRPSLQDANIHQVLLGKLNKVMAHRAKLYVKEFPSGQLTIRELKAHLDYLESVKSFVPAILIVDYPDLMDHDPKHKRNELTKLSVDLRGIAAERNIAVVGFSQANETKSKVIGMGRASEARGKEHTADTVLSLNQTPPEYDLGLLRIFAPKVRGEQKNVQVMVAQALALGQFCLSSYPMLNSQYWSLVNNQEESKDE